MNLDSRKTIEIALNKRLMVMRIMSIDTQNYPSQLSPFHPERQSPPTIMQPLRKQTGST